MAYAILNHEITVNLYNCCTCGTPIALEKNLERGLRSDGTRFYCPNGHAQVFNATTEADKLRAELKRKEQELANIVQEKLRAQAETAEAKKKLVRLHKGVCSCCNRSFTNLAEHIKTAHPELIGRVKRKYTKKQKI